MVSSKESEMQENFEIDSDILGSIDAQDDPFLLDYYVSPQRAAKKPIIIGGWGMGKTAILLKKSEYILKFLYNTNEFSEKTKRIWYIEESSIRIIELSAEIRRATSDSLEQSEALYKAWDTEITRRLLIQLVELAAASEHRFSGNHWTQVRLLQKNTLLNVSTWTTLIERLKSVSPRVGAVLEIFDVFSAAISKDTYRHINQCISDLSSHGIPKPIVLIEPIEKPAALDDEVDKFVDLIISVLLDLWYDKYRNKRAGNKIRVHLSIPWHRYEATVLRAPQKYGQYISQVRWSKDNLRNLIDERLHWKERQYGRSTTEKYSEKAVWYRIFPYSITNQRIENELNRMEDSFDYFIRHTCWRPRDLITLCSECIQRHCEEEEIEESEFFSTNETVSEKIVRTVISEKSRDISSWRLLEFARKYNNPDCLEEIFTGISSPVAAEILLDRTKLFSELTNTVGEQELVRQLWDSDIIGVCIEVETNADLDLLLDSYGDAVLSSPKKIRRGESDVIGVLFLFRYNTPLGESPMSIVSKYHKNSYFVLHPVFHEKFGVNSSKQYPIGC